MLQTCHDENLHQMAEGRRHKWQCLRHPRNRKNEEPCAPAVLLPVTQVHSFAALGVGVGVAVGVPLAAFPPPQAVKRTEMQRIIGRQYETNLREII